MNEDSSFQDANPETAIPESLATSDQSARNQSEWPPDEKEKTAENDAGQQNRVVHLCSWASFWILTWAGTTLSGALFGGALGMLGIFDSPAIPILGFFYGAIWAGVTGLFVFIHIGVFCWTFWLLDRPIVVAIVAGLVVGSLCGALIFSLITGPLGAFGAYLAGKQFLKSETGKTFQATIESTRAQSAGHLKFTTTDLLLRVTVISVMIAVWTGMMQSV